MDANGPKLIGAWKGIFKNLQQDSANLWHIQEGQKAVNPIPKT